MKNNSQHLLLFLGFLIALPTALLASIDNTNARLQSLNELAWESRIIITSVTESKAMQKSILDGLYEQRSELKQRKLRVFVVQSEQVYEYSLNNAKRGQMLVVSESFAEQVKQKLGTYHTLLIGLDGGSKASYESLAFDELYRDIDGMPMRRAELKNAK